MCVVHQQNVTVWRVSGTLPKLNFKQVRKINVRPVPQGCLWNPCNDVLCLLSRHQCSFYFRHDHNKGSYAFPALENGSIVCGCWSPDGTKLIICVGTVLLIYRWPDIGSSLGDFAATAWRIPGLEGKLTSITPVLRDSIVVAAEVPLENLCKQQDLFKVPDAQGDGQKNSDGVIRPLKSTSPMNSLMNLQQNSEAISDSRSILTVVHLNDQSRDPIKLSTVPLKGILTPDILMYEKSSQCVVVGSNSQSQLHIYALLEKYLAYCGNIQLNKNQRPKGLCSIPSLADDHGAALLILVGQRSAEESAFLSTSIETEFTLSLKYIMLKAGSSHHSKHSHHSDRKAREASSAHTKSYSLIRPDPVAAHHVKTLSDPSMQIDTGKREQQKSDMVLKDNPAELTFSPIKDSSLELDKLVTKPLADDSTHKKQLIEDLSSDPFQEEQLQVEKVSFSSQVPSFDNSKLSASYQLGPTVQSKVDQVNTLEDSNSEYPQGVENVGEAHEKSQLLKSSTSMEEQFQTETGKHFKSNSISERINSADICQVESKEDGCRNTEANNEYMQKRLSCSLNLLQNSNQASLLTTSTPISSQTEKITLRTHLQSEIKPRITTIGSETRKDFLEDLSNSDVVDQMFLPSSQTDSINTSKDFSNSMTDSALQMSLVSSQTDSVCSSEDFSSLLADRKPQVTSVSLQTEDADSSGCFYSSSESNIKVSNPSAFSQTEQDLPTDVKAETKSMCSQTEGASYFCVPNLQPETLETTDHSIQTEPNTSDDLDNPQFQLKSEASSCLHSATNPSDGHLYNTTSDLQSMADERTDILCLKGHDLGHAKEDTLSDFGLGSSQHSIDSSWDALEKEARSQKDSIDALHRRLELLSSSVDKTSCVFPTKYQDMSSAEIIEIYCEKPEGTESKKFLLDNGRLQLEPIKLTFGLATVEIWLDGVPCVTGANIDGYIPLKFSPFTRLHITGQPANK